MPYNANHEYFNRIAHPDINPLSATVNPGRLDKNKNAKAVVQTALSLRNQDEQYRTDTAFWYGTLASPRATDWKQDLIRRVFAILHFGGLMVKPNGGGAWHSWHGTDWPIAAAMSHSARIMVQIESGANGTHLWNWLWGAQAPQTRSAATHGVVPLHPAEAVVNHRHKHFLENKKDNLTQHGVNIGLGGVGKKNPHSGNTIEENGEHGHLYIGYHAPTATTRGALLIGCEPSAPADMWDGHSQKGPGMWWNAAFVGVPDQQGEGHGIGGGQDYSGTGSMRWDRGIFHNDDNRPQYYNGLFVDISEHGECAPFVGNQHNFTDDLLGNDGLAVPNPPPPAIDHGWVMVGEDD